MRMGQRWRCHRREATLPRRPQNVGAYRIRPARNTTIQHGQPDTWLPIGTSRGQTGVCDTPLHFEADVVAIRPERQWLNWK